jgi:serine/threonine protein kinase
MWGVRPLDKLDTETKYECLGRPLKAALPSDLWRQGELVKTLEFPQSLLTHTVYLGDFGLATKLGTQGRLSVLDIIYHAPERYHNVNPSFASDMWSYMCLFIELYIGFIPWERPDYLSMITEMTRTLGPLPKQWQGFYNAYGKYHNSWYDQCRKPNHEANLESIIKKKRPDVSLAERNHVLEIRHKC